MPHTPSIHVQIAYPFRSDTPIEFFCIGVCMWAAVFSPVLFRSNWTNRVTNIKWTRLISNFDKKSLFVVQFIVLIDWLTVIQQLNDMVIQFTHSKYKRVMSTSYEHNLWLNLITNGMQCTTSRKIFNYVLVCFLILFFVIPHAAIACSRIRYAIHSFISSESNM